MNISKKTKKVLYSALLAATVTGVTGGSEMFSQPIQATESSVENPVKGIREGNKLTVPQLQKIQQAAARAGSKKLIDDPGTTVVKKDTMIPSEYGFFVQFIQGKTTVETIGDGWKNSMHSPKNEEDDRGISIDINKVEKGKSGVIYRHVSAFGQDIDAKFTIKDYKLGTTSDGKTLPDGAIAFNKKTQVGAYENRIAEATFTIEFLKSGTNEPVELTGFHTFSDIDWTQYIRLDRNVFKHVKTVLADPSSWLILTENEDGSKTFAEVNNKGSDDMDVHAMFTVLFEKLSKFDVAFGTESAARALPLANNFEWSWFGNTAVKPAKSDDPNPTKEVSDSDQTSVTQNTLTDMKEVYTYTIKQSILGELAQFYHKSFELIDELVPELERTSEVKVVDETGKDRTSWFKDQSKDNKVNLVATADALKTADFYGHTYSFSFQAKVREGQNLEKYLNKEANHYRFPNKAKTIINGKEKPTNETDTDVPEIPVTPPTKRIVDKDGKEQELVQYEKGDKVTYVVKNEKGLPYGVTGKTVSLYDDLEDVLKLDDTSVKIEMADLASDEWTDITEKGELTTDEKTEKTTWTIKDAAIMAEKQYRMTVSGTLKESGEYSKYVDESGKIMIPNIAHQVIDGNEIPSNEVDVEIPDLPLTPPTKKVLDKDGAAQDLAQFKKGEDVSFVVSNVQGVPYAVKGQKITLFDDLEDVIDAKEIKVEVAELGSDKWTDVTDQGTTEIDDQTEKATWTLDDGEAMAGKQYRMMISGTLKEDSDYTKYLDESGNITIPNVAHQVIGDSDEPTNKVDVVVAQEKPKMLPPTGAQLGMNGHLLTAAIAGISVVGLSATVYVRRKKGTSHENTHK